MYKSKTMVEYQTPAEAEGLGTLWVLQPDKTPISGLASLVGKAPDLLLLAVRLPSELGDLTSIIIQQVEREATPLQH